MIGFPRFYESLIKIYLIQKNISLMAYKQSQESQENQFGLRALTSHIKSLDTTMIFQQPSSESKKQHADSKNTLLTYNTDRLYFTPTFILPDDQNYYRLNETFERYLFKEKIQRNLQFLKPTKTESTLQSIRFSSPTNHFCQICQQKFANYFEHTSSLEHQLLAKNSDFNKSIQQLCSIFTVKKKKKINKRLIKDVQTPHLIGFCKPETRLSQRRSSESNKSQISSTRIMSE